MRISRFLIQEGAYSAGLCSPRQTYTITQSNPFLPEDETQATRVEVIEEQMLQGKDPDIQEDPVLVYNNEDQRDDESEMDDGTVFAPHSPVPRYS